VCRSDKNVRPGLDKDLERPLFWGLTAYDWDSWLSDTVIFKVAFVAVEVHA